MGTYEDGFDRAFEKFAGPFGAIAAALGGHLAENAAAVKGHASNLQEVLAHKGFQHGLLSDPDRYLGINKVRKFSVGNLFGPENLGSYESAHALGSKIQQLFPNPEERNFVLRQMAAGGAKSGLTDAPLVGPLAKALHHEIHGTTPELQAHGLFAKGYGKLLDHLTNQTTTGFETGTQKALGAVRGAAPLAAASAVFGPADVATHVGMNMARSRLAQAVGPAEFLGGQIGKGMTQPLPTGLHKAMLNYGVTPSIMEARELGHHLKSIPGAERTVRDVIAPSAPFMRSKVFPHLPGALQAHPLYQKLRRWITPNAYAEGPAYA